MAFNLVSLLQTISTPSVKPAVTNIDNNNNPFASSDVFSFRKNEYYGKNRPVAGGYFAGYYNGKPNIVGRKLFIEV